MNKERAIEVHQFIIGQDLLTTVELNTKKNWLGKGSRATYYKAIQDKQEGKEVGLVGMLMLLEAERLMEDKQELMQEMATSAAV